VVETRRGESEVERSYKLDTFRHFFQITKFITKKVAEKSCAPKPTFSVTFFTTKSSKRSGHRFVSDPNFLVWGASEMCATLLQHAFERGVVLQNIRILARRILMRLRNEAYLSSRSGRRMYKRVFVVLLRMRHMRDHFFSKLGPRFSPHLSPQHSKRLEQQLSPTRESLPPLSPPFFGLFLQFFAS
jgi:hypothetical protein